MTVEQLLHDVKALCPVVVTRKKAQEITGGAVKVKTLANKDSLGCGPAVRVKISGGRVAYPRGAFIEWLAKEWEVQRALF
ncbi:hypothetical protein [Halodesulfovibrio marinisediminis]|uniref:Uncharacterized protein n=1 Tax=Halodesulfovibrio marinisediminis DSM 17456 TaxID=1121457 RepID=A0A1N6IFU9_9BACT|nr:hypothetical protein [Halodesulfovibrio marinisediminis]SIO30893.1 hypothetical protein SAMN02745161_2710 [Halodesulfovibrio marinisediminis DSM 17456]